MQIADSARLTYRLMGQADGQALWELDQDPDVMLFINGGKPNSMSTINKTILPPMKAYTNVKKGWGIWQVSDKVTQEYLGWVLVRPMDFFTDVPKLNDLELGWRFFQKSWGKGYATEAATTIKNNVVRQLNIDYVSATALEGNHRSIGVMKKMGLSFIRQYTHKDPLGDFTAVHYQMPIK